MRDITAEIDRENRIITDLLTLVKMDKKSADLQISHMDINQLRGYSQTSASDRGQTQY